jgi:pimeloyl-ACP methyl ester carboxylesterase
MHAVCDEQAMSLSAEGLSSIPVARESHLIEPSTGSTAQPIQFDDCMGWLHWPTRGASTTAVIVCQGLRGDSVTGYRSFRILATALAAAGFPTLRFDYPGTGDSGEPEGPEYWEAWLQSIEKAADWMRLHAGVDRIILCGLRIGATLATIVSERRTDISGLVLIAPVIRGRSYIRELSTEITVRGGKAQASLGLETDDFHLSAETVRLINDVNLADRLPPAGCRIVVYTRGESPALSNCIAKWTESGVTVTSEDFTALEPMLRPGFMAHEPSADVSGIVTWVRSTGADLTSARVPDLTTDRVTLRLDGCIEEPLRFGPDHRLIGILCRPIDRTETDKIVVIVNSSGDPHQGVARLNVVLARNLAAAGIPSFRIDFAGLGESVAPGDPETHIFETDRNGDVSAALDALSTMGYHRFAIQGLCSGAYHAFRAALVDRRITDLITVNLPLFRWRTGDSVEFLSYVGASPLAQLPKLASVDSLKRLFHSDPLALYSRIAMQSTWFSGLLKTMTRLSTRLFGDRVSFTFAQRCMRDLRSHARVLLLYAEGDQGIVNFEKEFSVKRPPAGITVMTIPGMDHSLTNRDIRRVVIARMTAFLNGSSAN